VGEECCDKCYWHLVLPVSTLVDRWIDDQNAPPDILIEQWLDWFRDEYLGELDKLDAAKDMRS
jgi:hypothetical protein